MKRSPLNRGDKPLERKTPLKNSEIKSIAKWLARQSKTGRRNKPLGYRVRDTGPDRETRALVLERDERRCQACGSTRDLQLQHRLPRQQGGTKSMAINSPANLITLCLLCHDRVERVERLAAYRLGMLVHRGEDPASKPVETIRGWLLLATDGSYEVVSGPDGEPDDPNSSASPPSHQAKEPNHP